MHTTKQLWNENLKKKIQAWKGIRTHDLSGNAVLPTELSSQLQAGHFVSS